MKERLYRLRHKLAAGIVIAVVVNLLALGAFVWSADGQRTTVDVQVRGEDYSFWIDGLPVVPMGWDGRSPINLESPEQGSISIILQKRVPSLPNPQGIESVVVRDLQGRELFRDDFETLDEERWTVTHGSFRLEDGVLVPLSQPGHNTVRLNHEGWRDYVVSVTFRNPRGTGVGTRLDEEGGVYFWVDMILDHQVFTQGFTPEGELSGTYFFRRIHTAKTEVIQSKIAMVLQSYPFILAGLVAGTLVSSVLPMTRGTHRRLRIASRRWRRAPSPGIRRAMDHAPLAAVIVTAVFAFGITLYILREVYTRVAHLPDESSYIFQAKLFASGRITGPIPPVKEAFYAWEPNFLYEHNERWATLYPFGHPLMLTPGALFDAVWLIPPLVGAGCVVLMFLVGRRMFDTRIGVIAAVLLAASPFFFLQAGNFMSHNTWMFYILLSLFFLLKRERVFLYGALSGLFFGLALNTRTAETVTLVVPIGVVLLAYIAFAPRQDRLLNAKYLVAFCFGGGLMLLAMLGFNAATTGDPFVASYTAWTRETPGSEVVGFYHGHTPDIGLRNLQAQLMAYLLVLHAWPAWVGLAFVAVPFILGTRNRWDYFLLVCALLVAGLYVLYSSSMLYMGPRYWYQTMPFVLLLTARGMVLAGAFLGDAATRLRQRVLGDARSVRWAGILPVYVLVAVLLVNGTGGWIFGWNQDQFTEDDIEQVQNNMNEVRQIYGFDDRLIAFESGLENALILLMPCGHYNEFGCYNTIFDRNSVTFDGDIVWARFMPEHLDDLLAAFPDRNVYVADYVEETIRPFEPENDLPPNGPI